MNMKTTLEYLDPPRGILDVVDIDKTWHDLPWMFHGVLCEEDEHPIDYDLDHVDPWIITIEFADGHERFELNMISTVTVIEMVTYCDRDQHECFGNNYATPINLFKQMALQQSKKPLLTFAGVAGDRPLVVWAVDLAR